MKTCVTYENCSINAGTAVSRPQSSLNSVTTSVSWAHVSLAGRILPEERPNRSGSSLAVCGRRVTTGSGGGWGPVNCVLSKIPGVMVCSSLISLCLGFRIVCGLKGGFDRILGDTFRIFDEGIVVFKGGSSDISILLDYFFR